MERMERRKNFRKGLAYTLIMAMTISAISFGASIWGFEGTGKAYAGTVDSVSDAVSSTLTGYYGTHENYVLHDWEEMAVVKASGGNLEDYILPKTDTGTASSTVIAALLKGDTTTAGIKATTLVSGGALVSAEDAYKYALNIVAIEAYNRSISESEKIGYSTAGAIHTLLAYRTDGIFLDPYNQAPGGDMVGMSLVALSAFSGDGGIVDGAIIGAKEQIKKMQNASGAFEGAWGYGSADANTTAVIIWGLMAVDSSNLSSYTTGGALKTPTDGLLSYYVTGGGFGYNDHTQLNAYATKQAALAMADIYNNHSFYATLSASAINYVGAEVQLITANSAYTEKKLTMGSDKTIAKAIQRGLVTTGGISYSDYHIYVNGILESDPSSVTVKESDTVLAVAKTFTKVAYFKTADSDTMRVNEATTAFGGSRDLTLVEKNLQSGEELVLANKPLSVGTAMTSNFGATDSTGKITITPIESGVGYEIKAKYSAWDFSTNSMKAYIATDTAILPALITMSAGSPQTATVSVRIEGPNANILNDTALTVVRTDGSRLTAFDAITQALSKGGITYVQNSQYISSIDGFAAGTYGTNHWDGWMYNIIKPEYLNGTSSVNGMGTQFITGGEEILVYYGNDSMTTVYPLLNSKLNGDGSVTIEIKNYETDWVTYKTNLVSTSGVTVDWGYTSGTALTYSAVTDIDGRVVIPNLMAKTGQHPLQIRKGQTNLPDIIRLAPQYTIGISSAGTSEGSGGAQTVEAAYLTVKGSNGYLKSRTSYTWYQGMTALYILQSSGLGIETDSSGNYVQSVEGVGEFDLGKNSGWLYAVNGVTPTNKASNAYILSPNDHVLWYYTLDFTKDDSSSAWVGEKLPVAGDATTSTVRISAEAKMNALGAATASIGAKELTAAIKSAVSAAEKQGSGTTTQVEIKVETDSKATAVSASIPQASMSELNKSVDKLSIVSPIATLTFDREGMKTISAQANGDVKITASKVDLLKLPVALQTEVGGRPVYDFTVISGTKKISEFGSKVRVSIPYVPTEDENTNALVIYYINEAGQLDIIRNGAYNVGTKMMTFSTDHFSNYAIGYELVSFPDVKGYWAQGQIEYLAARGIIKGKAQGLFKPKDNITRAEFVAILGNKFGADYGKDRVLAFGDIKAGDWFAGAVAWAAENKIVTGADGKFRPNDNISRQEMAVILDRYITNLEKTNVAVSNKRILFSDDAQIGGYAKASVSKMQQMGIINGKQANVFAPEDKATRGEAAKMIATYMKTAL